MAVLSAGPFQQGGRELSHGDMPPGEAWRAAGAPEIPSGIYTRAKPRGPVFVFTKNSEQVGESK